MKNALIGIVAALVLMASLGIYASTQVDTSAQPGQLTGVVEVATPAP